MKTLENYYGFEYSRAEEEGAYASFLLEVTTTNITVFTTVQSQKF